MGDNGGLNKLKTPNLGQAETKQEPQPEKQGEQKPQEPPKDFKIAEIWIKNDTVALDAVPNFWMDKLRAIGILEFCKEIVKNSNPADRKPRIFLPRAHNMINGARRMFGRKR